MMDYKSNAVKEEKTISEKVSRIAKLKLCLISNYGYMYLRGNLQNFALDSQL